MTQVTIHTARFFHFFVGCSDWQGRDLHANNKAEVSCPQCRHEMGVRGLALTSKKLPSTSEILEGHRKMVDEARA